MEKEIEKLIELANKYVEFGKETGLLLNTHNWLEKTDVGIGVGICVYFGDDYDISSVYFEKIEIMNYANTIRFPFYTNAEYLCNVCESAQKTLNNLIRIRKKETEETAKKKREQKILALEKQLKLLKNF